MIQIQSIVYTLYLCVEGRELVKTMALAETRSSRTADKMTALSTAAPINLNSFSWLGTLYLQQ